MNILAIYINNYTKYNENPTCLADLTKATLSLEIKLTITLIGEAAMVMMYYCITGGTALHYVLLLHRPQR